MATIQGLFIPQSQQLAGSHSQEIKGHIPASLLHLPSSMQANRPGSLAESNNVTHTTLNQRLSIHLRHTSATSSVAPAPNPTAAIRTQTAWENKGAASPMSDIPGTEVKIPLTQVWTSAKKFYRYGAPHLEATKDHPEKRKELIAQIATLSDWFSNMSKGMYPDSLPQKAFKSLSSLVEDLNADPKRELSLSEKNTILLWHNKVQYTEFTELNFTFDSEEPENTYKQNLKELTKPATEGLNYLTMVNFLMRGKEPKEPRIELSDDLQESKKVLSSVLEKLKMAIKGQTIFTATISEITAITKLYAFAEALPVAPQREIPNKPSKSSSTTSHSSLRKKLQTSRTLSNPSILQDSLLPNQPVPRSPKGQVSAPTLTLAPNNLRTLRPQPSVATITLPMNSNSASKHLVSQAPPAPNESTAAEHKINTEKSPARCVIQ